MVIVRNFPVNSSISREFPVFPRNSQYFPPSWEICISCFFANFAYPTLFYFTLPYANVYAHTYPNSTLPDSTIPYPTIYYPTITNPTQTNTNSNPFPPHPKLLLYSTLPYYTHTHPAQSRSPPQHLRFPISYHSSPLHLLYPTHSTTTLSISIDPNNPYPYRLPTRTQPQPGLHPYH